MCERRVGDSTFVGGEWDPPLPGDSDYMLQALELAREAAERGEVPVGALVVAEGQILGKGYNRRESWGDPTAHAEMLAIREAAAVRGGWRLAGCTLYVTLEPCAMCAGAIVLARLDRLVYGAADPKAGAVGSLMNVVQDPRLNHWVRVTRGVEEEACGHILREFFRLRR